MDHPATPPTKKENLSPSCHVRTRSCFWRLPFWYIYVYIYIYVYNIQFGLQRWQALLLVFVGTLYLQCILPGSCWHPLLCYPISLLPREDQCSTWWGLSQRRHQLVLTLKLCWDSVLPKSQHNCVAKRIWNDLNMFSKRMPSQVLVHPGGLPRPALDNFCRKLQLMSLGFSKQWSRKQTTIMNCLQKQDPLWSTDWRYLCHLLST